jgi:hypothetical protein
VDEVVPEVRVRGDRGGKTTPELFEKINLRLAQSVTARNALGRSEKENAREIATMLYGEVHPDGHFRFVNFGHPPPLVFSLPVLTIRQYLLSSRTEEGHKKSF